MTTRNSGSSLKRSAIRIAVALSAVFIVTLSGYLLWQPGLEVRDGRHDRGSNAIWIAHGWLGGNEWFTKYNKLDQLDKYRVSTNITALAEKLRANSISDVFPHLCPAELTGELPPVDPKQTEQFLDAFAGFRVFPWIGGPNGSSVRLNNAKWRARFITDITTLLSEHPRFAGIHLNVEPLPSGDKDFLQLLEEINEALPDDKLLSVAAYPPPTWWHPFPDVHWEESYFREVAKRCDHMAVMMYDAGQKIPKTYQRLMADWTAEVLQWSEGRPVLLGVPTYEDADVEYHDPKVENLTNALAGIHRGLVRSESVTNYQGVAIYCDWETSGEEWAYFRAHFQKP